MIERDVALDPARSPAAFKRYARHPLLAEQMGRDPELSAEVCEVIAAHHERFDETGFPSGRSGHPPVVLPAGSRRCLHDDARARRPVAQRCLPGDPKRRWQPVCARVRGGFRDGLRANLRPPPLTTAVSPTRRQSLDKQSLKTRRDAIRFPFPMIILKKSLIA